MNVYWLDTPECRDPGLTGGKAANLARLSAAQPVPPGFAVRRAQGTGRRAPGAGRRDDARLSASECEEIEQAYALLGERCGGPGVPVAVRSSAVDEDGLQASFAGQHDSYLNVSGAQAVVDAVEACLASARAPRARQYRRAHGLPQEARIAVLVQQLVVSDVSAVVFSADPRAGAYGGIAINAAWGLGESLVGGSVTPDLYVVDRRTLAVITRQIARKDVMSVLAPAGTREVPVPRCMREEPALSERQVAGLARLAIELEEYQGWAVDLECAYARGTLYLLQCRPITTLALPVPVECWPRRAEIVASKGESESVASPSP